MTSWLVGDWPVRSGQIVLTTYGRSSGFCIDPVEKKPLYHSVPEAGSILRFW